MSGATLTSEQLGLQLAALREGAAVASPGQRVVVGVRGADTLGWLDRLCSTPVKDLPAACCRWSTLMDGKGKLRADLRLIHQPGGDWLLELPASHGPALRRVLDMYILRDKVELQDLSASHAFLALLGPRAGAVATACGLPQPAACGGGGDSGSRSGSGDAADGPLDGSALADAVSGALVLPSRLYGADGFDLLAPVGALDSLRARLVAAGATPVELPALQVARIEHGVPWFAEDLSDSVIPLEAGLVAQVSITKGCYPGQEIVARISNLGQVARKLVRLSAEMIHAEQSGIEPSLLLVPSPLTGTAERAGQEAGRLTSIALDPSHSRLIGLGFVRRAFWTPGTRLAAGGVELSVEGDARS